MTTKRTKVKRYSDLYTSRFDWLADVKMEDATEEEEPAPEPEPEKAQSTPSREETPPVTTSGGRRRGKRRVTRKNTTKDDEGFLGELPRCMAFHAS